MSLSGAYGYPGSSREIELARLATQQHGVVSTAQLHDLGYSKRSIQRRAESARLQRLHRGVYAVGHARLSVRGVWLAAVLACGPRACLSHQAAAALWDLRSIPSGAIDVTAASRHDLKGIRCHTSRLPLHPDDQTKIDAIPVTTVPRTLLDLAEILHPQRLRSILEAAQHRDLLNPEQMRELLQRSPGRHGLKPLQHALATLGDQAPWTQSQLERAFLELVRDAGLPEHQANVILAGELVDCYWPDHNLIVELDGWGTHKTKRQFNADRRRDTKLQIAGCRVVRLTYDRVVYERQATARDLIKLLGEKH
jgi:very-short-patch-repair endonuclease